MIFHIEVHCVSRDDFSMRVFQLSEETRFLPVFKRHINNQTFLRFLLVTAASVPS
jgi:hypothetical protein